jgi:cytochrome P450
MEPTVRVIAHALVDRFIEQGRADLVLDLANPLPAIITMKLLGLPLADWETYATAMHKVLYTRPDTEEFAELSRQYSDLARAVFVTVAERRAVPTDDLLSCLATTEIRGERLDDERIGNIVHLVIAGGVDTTTALTANALLYLAEHPEERARLVAEPDRRALAAEEFLRFFSPIQALARTVTADTELGGQQLRAGDRVLVCWAGANHDPAQFAQPDEVVLDRFPNRHTAFGLGLHRCVGSNLARSEFKVMLDVVLDRLADYQIDVEAVAPYPSIGVVNGYIRVPATFTPGPLVGAAVGDW